MTNWTDVQRVTSDFTWVTTWAKKAQTKRSNNGQAAIAQLTFYIPSIITAWRGYQATGHAESAMKVLLTEISRMNDQRFEFEAISDLENDLYYTSEIKQIEKFLNQIDKLTE